MRSTAPSWLLVTLTLSCPLTAQTGNKAAAEALFDAGRSLLAEGKFAEACPKLAESQRLDPAPGTLLNLADCYEKAGLSASAWATWLEAAAAAKTAGQTKREELARQRASALKSRLVSVTINVPDSSRVPGLEVTRDGTAVGLAMWGTAVPVDPGTHAVSARAPGRKTWQTTVTIVDGVQPVQVTVPVLEKELTVDAPIAQSASGIVEPAAAPSPGAEPTPEASASSPSPVGAERQDASRVFQPSHQGDAQNPSNAGSTQRILGYVATGVGVVGVGFGSFYGLRAISKNDDSRSECSTNTSCSSRGVTLREEAFDSASLSTIGFSVGIIALATGAVLLISSPSQTETTPKSPAQQAGLSRLTVGTLLSQRESGLTLKGAF